MNQVSVEMDFGALSMERDRCVIRASSFLALGRAADEQTALHPPSSGFNVRFIPDPVPDDLANEIRSEFQKWLTNSCMIELERGISTVLSTLYEFNFLMKTSKPVTVGLFEKAKRLIDSKSISDKVGMLYTEFDITTSQGGLFFGLNKARNCFLHSSGTVLNKHCTDADTLRIEWLTMGIFDEDTNEVRDGHFFASDTSIFAKMYKKGRKFRVGEQLSLGYNDISEICFSTYVALSEMITATQDRAMALGILKSPDA